MSTLLSPLRRAKVLWAPLCTHVGTMVLSATFSSAAWAQSPTQPQTQTPASKTADEQVIVPQVERREIYRPRFPSNDFAVTLFAGSYATQNFGSNLVTGLRLGYHITEDFFIEGSLGRTKISDEAFRQILPGGVFASASQKLSYYNVGLGYNVLNSESFFGRNVAKLTQGYLIAGTGSTKIAEQKKLTFMLGFGARLVLNDWFVIQADARENLFQLDLLGQRKNTRNPEITAGFTVTF
jgi:outer membrane beta-barrel protein